MAEFFYNIILFFIYSVIGYLIEIISVSITEKKITLSRGYLIGPYLPIFGCGGLGGVLFLTKYKNDIVNLFVLSVAYSCILEYITSLILEKIFKLRWWDYSRRKLNLNGRISLETGVAFGIFGIIIVCFIQPFLVFLLSFLTKTQIIVLGITLFIILISDFIISTYTISKLKINTNKYSSKDSTAVVKKEVIAQLQKYSLFYRRLFYAFPNFLNYKNYIKIEDFIINKKKKKKIWEKKK